MTWAWKPVAETFSPPAISPSWQNTAEAKSFVTKKGDIQLREYNHFDVRSATKPWTPKEDLLMIEGRKQFGNRWKEVARRIPGRTENAIKNHWNANIRRMQRCIKNTGKISLQSVSKRELEDLVTDYLSNKAIKAIEEARVERNSCASCASCGSHNLDGQSIGSHVDIESVMTDPTALQQQEQKPSLELNMDLIRPRSQSFASYGSSESPDMVAAVASVLPNYSRVAVPSKEHTLVNDDQSDCISTFCNTPEYGIATNNNGGFEMRAYQREITASTAVLPVLEDPTSQVEESPRTPAATLQVEIPTDFSFSLATATSGESCLSDASAPTLSTDIVELNNNDVDESFLSAKGAFLETPVLEKPAFRPPSISDAEEVSAPPAQDDFRACFVGDFLQFSPTVPVAPFAMA